jgi:outer membrane biosynthesis protein TonB
MQQRTVIRSTTMFLGLLLMSLLLLFAVNEYEKSRAFQWQNMVQPHWEGEVPQVPLLLPLATEKADAVVISPDVGKGEVDLAQPPPPVKDVEPSVEEIKKPEVVKKPEPVSNAAVAVVKNKSQPQVPKATTTPKKALRLRMKEDLYYGHTSRWEVKKQKEMPDFFAQKTNPDDVRLGGHLIMEGDDNSTASRNNQDKKNGDGGYLDAIQGAELKISIPMR